MSKAEQNRTAEHLRKVMVELAELSGWSLREVKAINLSVHSSDGAESFVAEVLAPDGCQVVHLITHQPEGALRASVAALRAMSEPDLAGDESFAVLDERGETLGRAQLQSQGKRR